jgi:hypothetical protein
MRLTTAILSIASIGVTLFWFCETGLADPVMHDFQIWNGNSGNSPFSEKLALYLGWANGLLHGAGHNADTQAKKDAVKGLIDCLYNIEYRQAVAMIDKYYKEHPEGWRKSFSEEMLRAVTVSGGSCEGKNPWPDKLTPNH